MLANSVSKFLNYYGVCVGKKVVVFTNNDLSPTTLSPNQWHTIDELFDIAKTAINEAHIYSIEYDNSPYGNPKIIDIDWAENTADDEVTFYINNVSKK